MKGTKRFLWPLALAVALGVGGVLFTATYVRTQEGHGNDTHEHDHSADSEHKTIHTCPMHPQIVQDDPGTCPICGMDLVPKKVAPKGKAAPSASKAPAHAHGEHPADSEHKTIHTCPMHPQIVQDDPGTCPICGMDLVPKKVDAEGKAVPSKSPAAALAEKQRKIKHWVAPMDPTYISDKPGKSPMGMDLVPVYEDEGGGSAITIDPVVVQNMGVRIAAVRQGPIFRHIRTIGTIGVAENLLSVVNLRYSGWIERIHVDETGVLVKKGRPLFRIYSPEVVAAQQEYLMALRTGDAQSPLVKSARTRLELWNLHDAQIQQIEKQGKPMRSITVVAPQTGYVLHKNVVQGARVQAGADLYRIGSLAKIWVNADVYEFDAPWVKLGAPATMELSFQHGEIYKGSVAYIYPTLNPQTRTLSVRLEFDNPGLDLKPGMFATVQIEAERKDDVSIVPTEAIIHSGMRQLVFVALDLGRYEMREITTGLAADRHLTEVISGLSPGERVVTSGQFLLDSESQLQEAVQKLLAARLHAKEKRVAPSSPAEAEGHREAEGGAEEKGREESGGETYWTCGMHPQIVQHEPGTCPICGMDLVEKKK